MRHNGLPWTRDREIPLLEDVALAEFPWDSPGWRVRYDGLGREIIVRDDLHSDLAPGEAPSPISVGG